MARLKRADVDGLMPVQRQVKTPCASKLKPKRLENAGVQAVVAV